ncbi:TetR/AcrR family transcriptional regulator [Leptolyngbya sp. FACHB-261]|uniref:TetR/AcrR family transcriptional regulator n=1 Tax=Leptolyngbya sp. FACHB-261 TaxID=2692806 RepID=UPI0016882E24|nr:TetR/AcrR family transcriptional regulator [Leptolyngbya sp. FACHB-261]MBD2100547.1 TetR/AcrR family transcriptional regulator [Leptolyngbya sp. FACHB-261]
MAQAQTPGSSRRKAPGQQTRQAILQVAVDIASAEGLEGLTIGRLAAELGMSKSGLFAHFGSKQDLQLAVIETACAIFAAEVRQPALTAPVGRARLLALCQAWFSFVERKVFRGGCFFAATSIEFDSRPGPVRDQLAQVMKGWLSWLESLIQEAQEAGELNPNLEAAQLAFEIHALMWGANWVLQLHEDPQAIARARTAILHRLEIKLSVESF